MTMMWARMADLMRSNGLAPGALAIAFALLVLNLAWVSLTEHSIVWSGSFKTMAVFVVLLAFAFGLARRGYKRAAAACGSLAILLFNIVVSIFTSLIGLTLGFPLIDSHLAAFDAILRIDHAAVIGWAAGQPSLGTVMVFVYNLSLYLMPLIIIRLAFEHQFERLRVFVFVFSAGLAISALISSVLPAVGSYVHFDLLRAGGDQLPPGSGVYHLEYFEKLRSGAPQMLDFVNAAGIITFPSFHTIIALLLVQGCWGVPALRWFSVGLCSVTLLATFIIGGHYLADMLAGGLIFFLLLSVASLQNAGAAEALALRMTPAE